MAFLGDYHTHTTYSRNGKRLHGKGSVMQNAEAAARAGLIELAITDHGYGHYYGIESEQAFEEFRAECERAEKATGIKIYAGLENNLDPRSGKKELPAFIGFPSDADKLEIIQGGYHAFIGTPTFIKNELFWTRNVIFKFIPSKKLRERNTAAYKKLIDEYPIDFIGHLNRGIISDAVEVARYAHEHGVYIELNGRHRSLSKSEVKQMVAAGVEFICNSDAHRPDDVGKMPRAEELIKECGIPRELIANWDRLPSFRSENFRSARERKSSPDAGGADVDG